MNKIKYSHLSRLASLAVAILFGIIAIAATANAQDRDYDREHHDQGRYYNNSREHHDFDRDHDRYSSRSYYYRTRSPFFNVRYRRHLRHHRHMYWDHYNRR